MGRTSWVLILLLLPAALRADEIILKSGGRISGEIVERTETSVTVDIGAGTMAVEMAYVERIESGTSAVGEYRQRASQIAPGDAEAWRALGRWAESRWLGTQAREAYEHVLAVLPGDPEANQALGRVLYEGQWISEEDSYQARGFVEFEGEWMSPDERDRILDERAAEERAAQEAAAAQRQIDQAAQAAADRAAAEVYNSQGTGYGLPVYDEQVYWGWGAGPAVWPSNPGHHPNRPRPVQLPARGRR